MTMKKASILITGGSGYLGQSLATLLSPTFDVFLGSRNNKNNFFATRATGCPSLPLDVSSLSSVRDVISQIRPDIVIHAAATKFVDLSEKYPHETIDVNVLGSQNIARASIDFGVKYVIGISTDKAAPPCKNTYAISKALMERLFCSLDSPNSTRFTCVRYGNVAWSTGSVLPVWRDMIARDSSISSCGSNMFRYLFSVQDAASVVYNAITQKDICYGKILVKEMKSVKIIRLLDLVCSQNNISYKLLPPRQGERTTEYLVGAEELSMSRRITISGDPYILIDFANNSYSEITHPLSAETATPLSDTELISLINNMSPL